MRRILIERARRRSAERHGGGLRRVSLVDVPLKAEPPPETILAVDQALTKMEDRDQEMAQVVKLRYFAELSVEETAETLGLSVRVS